MANDELIFLDVFASEAEAQLALASLRSAGIGGEIRKEDLAATYGVGAVAVLVALEDVEEARTILAGGDTPDEALDLAASEARWPQEAPEAEPSRRAAGGPSAAVFLVGLIVGAALVGLIVLGSGKGSRTPDGEQTKDENDDGRPDVWFTYKGGELTGASWDRNFDGHEDAWRLFRKGVEIIDSWDSNFDGRVDRELNLVGGLSSWERDDRDFDGTWDGWKWYEGGVVTRGSEDLDGDGKVDYTCRYENGVMEISEEDTDGDGKMECARRYEKGILVTSESDADGNSVPDIFSRYSHSGNIEITEVRPNSAALVTRRFLYKNGRLAEEWVDRDGEGRLEEKITYGLFLDPRPPEKVSPALAQDAHPTIVLIPIPPPAGPLETPLPGT